MENLKDCKDLEEFCRKSDVWMRKQIQCIFAPLNLKTDQLILDELNHWTGSSLTQIDFMGSKTMTATSKTLQTF